MSQVGNMSDTDVRPVACSYFLGTILEIIALIYQQKVGSSNSTRSDRERKVTSSVSLNMAYFTVLKACHTLGMGTHFMNSFGCVRY